MKKIFSLMCIALAAFLEAPTLFGQSAAEAAKPASEEHLDIGTRVQFRAMAGEADSDHAGANDYDALDFNFRRIRLSMKYQAESWYGGVVDIKAENLLATNKSAIQEANMWIKPGFLDSKVTFGQFKLPFLREELTSSGRLLLPERARAVELLQQQDIGLLFAFNPLASSEAMAKKLSVSFSATNGDGSGHNGQGRKEVEANDPNENLSSLVNWRIEYAPIGKITSGGKEIFKNSNLLTFGVAGAHTEADEYTSNTLTDGEPIQGITGDFVLFMSGAYLNGEFTNFTGLGSGDQQYTYSATLGYLIDAGKFYVMPVVRYNYFQQDEGRDGTIDDADKVTDIWGGVNFFLDEHNLKCQIFYQVIQDSLGANGEDLANNLVYFQLQTNFGKKL